MQVAVDSLTFTFPDGWLVSKYDEWGFCRDFQKMKSGIKGVDLIAISPNKTLWLIEAKDFRAHPRTKPIPLHEEVWQKVYDTLAALLPAKLNASESVEQEFAGKILAASSIRVALQCEQPSKPSKLFPPSVSEADVQQKLKKMLKPIDPHPLVINRNRTHTAVEWTVQ